MRSRRPANWGQYVARPIPKTPTRARGAGRDSRPVRSMSELVVVIDSEVELVDVVLVERRQRAEHDLAVRADLVLAQPPGGERLARLAGDAPGDQGGCGLARE